MFGDIRRTRRRGYPDPLTVGSPDPVPESNEENFTLCRDVLTDTRSGCSGGRCISVGLTSLVVGGGLLVYWNACGLIEVEEGLQDRQDAVLVDRMALQLCDAMASPEPDMALYRAEHEWRNQVVMI